MSELEIRLGDERAVAGKESSDRSSLINKDENKEGWGVDGMVWSVGLSLCPSVPVSGSVADRY
jgi:hypothetical protein